MARVTRACGCVFADAQRVRPPLRESIDDKRQQNHLTIFGGQFSDRRFEGVANVHPIAIDFAGVIGLHGASLVVFAAAFAPEGGFCAELCCLEEPAGHLGMPGELGGFLCQQKKYTLVTSSASWASRVMRWAAE